MQNILLSKSVKAWGTEKFAMVFKTEFQSLQSHQLPLQQALRNSSSVSPSAFSVMLLQSFEADDSLQLKVAVMYKGIIAGCHCADDPSPMDEENEYCELQVNINKHTAKASIALFPSC